MRCGHRRNDEESIGESVGRGLGVPEGDEKGLPVPGGLMAAENQLVIHPLGLVVFQGRQVGVGR